MRNIFFILCLLIILLSACDPGSHSPGDYADYNPLTRMVKGVVVDDSTMAPLKNVSIGEKKQNVPDSIFFVGDSIQSEWKYIKNWVDTFSDGSFLLYYRKEDNPSFPLYGNYFAYKQGYHLWRFDFALDTAHRVSNIRDSLFIKLRRK